MGVGVAIVVIAVVAIAYAAGRSSTAYTPIISTTATQPCNADYSNTPCSSDTSQPQTNITPTAAPASTQASAQTTTNSDTITAGSSCEEMANKAAQEEEDAAVGFLVTEMQVTQSHVKNGQCYYELSYHTTGGSNGDVYETQINAAPNNTEIAYCGRGVDGTACFGISNGNSTAMSAVIFHTIETDLLTS